MLGGGSGTLVAPPLDPRPRSVSVGKQIVAEQQKMLFQFPASDVGKSAELGRRTPGASRGTRGQVKRVNGSNPGP